VPSAATFQAASLADLQQYFPTDDCDCFAQQSGEWWIYPPMMMTVPMMTDASPVMKKKTRPLPVMLV
jgi:hypothetical protein